MRVARPNARGNPTFIDVGGRFPSKERLGLVIWGDDASKFSDIQPLLTPGRVICVTGQVAEREGVMQVVLREREQVRLR